MSGCYLTRYFALECKRRSTNLIGFLVSGAKAMREYKIPLLGAENITVPPTPDFEAFEDRVLYIWRGDVIISKPGLDAKENFVWSRASQTPLLVALCPNQQLVRLT